MTKKLLYIVAFLPGCLLGVGQACADSPIAQEGGLTSPGISWYRDMLSDTESDRGPAASVNLEEARKVAQTKADIAEVFSLYEKSDLEAAVQKIGSLNRQLRGLEDPPSKRSLATLLDFKGVIFQRQGRLLDAISAHDEAIQLLVEINLNDSSLGVAVRNNLAVANYLNGEYEASKNILTGIVNSIGERTPITPEHMLNRARALNNRGLIYTDIGQADKALLDFSHAKADAREGKSRQLLAQILNNEGRVKTRRAGTREEAEEAFSKALRITVEIEDLGLQAEILDSWAELLVADGRFQDALDKLAAASEAEAKARAPITKASILKNRGRALAGLGKSKEAMQIYTEALELADGSGLSSQKRDILANRGSLHAASKDLNAAIEDYLAAIKLAESTRERLPGESEIGFIEATAHLYREVVSLLLKRKWKGDAEMAYSMLERSRSAVLQEQMAAESPVLRDEQAREDINGARGVLRQEAALAKKLQIALSASNSNMKDVDVLRQQLGEARSRAEAALAELREKYQGRYDHFVPAAVDPKYLKDIAGFLPPNSLLVTYSYGDDGLYIFLVSGDGKIDFRQNPDVKRTELENRINEYRSFIEKAKHSRSREDLVIDSWSDAKWTPFRDSTTWLYQQLLVPISDRLQSADQVIFAPTGLMYYLPFHALGLIEASGKQMQYLALSKKVSYVSRSSLLKAFDASREGVKGTRILAFGDVQFGRGSNLPQLDASKSELKAVADIFGRDAVLLQNKGATKQNLLNALKVGNNHARQASKKVSPGGYDFMLISTHGILQAKEPRTSFLAMENDNKLTAQEIGGLDLRGISLVTLSACETVLAESNPGADIMGLGEYISLAGASSVLATLWEVDDFQTANLMSRFYTHLKKEPANKTAALQYAQQALATHPESTHPFFWSPFVLYGRGW